MATSVLRPLNKVIAVVTGGSSGLGQATVETLVKGGARVAILDLPKSKGAEVAAALGPNAIFTPANVSVFTLDAYFLSTVLRSVNKQLLQVAKDSEVKAAFDQVEKYIPFL